MGTESHEVCLRIWLDSGSPMILDAKYMKLHQLQTGMVLLQSDLHWFHQHKWRCSVCVWGGGLKRKYWMQCLHCIWFCRNGTFLPAPAVFWILVRVDEFIGYPPDWPVGFHTFSAIICSSLLSCVRHWITSWWASDAHFFHPQTVLLPFVFILLSSLPAGSACCCCLTWIKPSYLHLFPVSFQLTISAILDSGTIYAQ